MIELAWNFHPESTEGCQVALSSDSYINEGIRAMAQLDATNFAACGRGDEQLESVRSRNLHPGVPEDCRRRGPVLQHSNGISPGDISNRNVTIDQFYPGDQYVDWVGMSTYQNSNYMDVYGNPMSYSLSGKPASNPYYGTGLYDYDPMVIIKPIIDLAASHNKPVMISECGFAYRNAYTGVDQTAYAVDQMTKFYSYVNMIYPR